MTNGELIRHLEVEGFVVLPNLLNMSTVEALRAQAATLPKKAVDYSPYGKSRPTVLRGGEEGRGLHAGRSMEVAGLRGSAVLFFEADVR